MHKQQLSQYNQTLKLYVDHIDELLKQTTAELDKINNTKLQPLPLKLRKFKHLEFKFRNYSLCVFKSHHIIAIIALIISSAIHPIVLTCRLHILYNLLSRPPLLPPH